MVLFQHPDVHPVGLSKIEFDETRAPHAQQLPDLLGEMTEGDERIRVGVGRGGEVIDFGTKRRQFAEQFTKLKVPCERRHAGRFNQRG